MENKYIKEFEKSFGDYDYLQKAVNNNTGSLKHYAYSNKPVSDYCYRCACKKEEDRDIGSYTFSVTISDEKGDDCLMINLRLENSLYNGEVYRDKNNEYKEGRIIVRFTSELLHKIGGDKIADYANRNKFYCFPSYRYGAILEKRFIRKQNADYYIDMTKRISDKIIDLIYRTGNANNTDNVSMVYKDHYKNFADMVSINLGD